MVRFMAFYLPYDHFPFTNYSPLLGEGLGVRLFYVLIIFTFPSFSSLMIWLGFDLLVSFWRDSMM